MEKNPYTMAKLGLEARENLRSNRDCGFYVKYFFLFLSLIQFLIILGLVLFMVYGNAQAGTEGHVQHLSDLLKKCEGKLGNVSKEKDTLKRQLNTSQVELRGLRTTVNRYNVSLKVCNDEKGRIRQDCQGSNNFYHMFVDCSVNLHLLNFTQRVKIQNLEEQLKTLTLKNQVDHDILSRDIKTLKESVATAEKEKDTCQLERIKAQGQEQKFRELENRVLDELRPLKVQLEATVNQALPSTTFSCYNQEPLHQLRQSCINLSNELNAQLGRLAAQVDQRVNAAAQENGLLQRDKAACSLDLQERDRRLRAQQQHAAHELEVHKTACDSETKKMYAERQRLIGEKESLQQQLEQVKQACKVIPGIVPGNRFAGLPGPGTGTWRSQGNFGNPGASAANPNLFVNPSFGRTGVPSPPAAGTILGTLENLGIYRNPLAAGTSGTAHGIPARPDRTRLEENKKFAMEPIKPQNQSTVNPVGQSRG
ncbi:plasmalemma vesicle-associated protein [Tiliqua scincoides]|uniref:plasmalemma vesicle-associated protein n=1 Tax=Tiliqua scincoides TaxID=71010 RepID=UPI003461AA9C